MKETPNAQKYVFHLVCNKDMSKSFEQRGTVTNVMLKD